MDTVTLVGRLLVSLAAVLGLMWTIGRRMKRTGGRAKSAQLIDVLGRQQLSRSASVAVVRIGEQALVIGVTDSQVSVLGETDLGAAQALVAGRGEARAAAGRGDTRAAGRVPAAGRGSHRSTVPTTVPTGVPAAAMTGAPVDVPADGVSKKAGALNGSALSPQTWRQTIDSLRDLTTRQA